MNASKLFISEECVQKHVWILCIHVILSHHILGFPWCGESITGICRQWVEKMASVDLSNSSFLHLLLLCSPISILPSLTAMTPYLPRSSFLAWLEVSQCSGFSSHRPPSSPPSPPTPSHPFIWSNKHFLCLVPPTFWDFSIRFPSLPQPPPIHPTFAGTSYQCI